MRKQLIQSSDTLMRTAPLLPVAVGMIGGILIDRSTEMPITVYLMTFLAAALLALPKTIRALVGPILVCLAAAALGGTMHAIFVRQTPATSIARYTGPDRRIARVTGTVVSPPRMLAASPHPFSPWTFQSDRTTFLLEVHSIEGTSGHLPVTGRIRVTVQEALLDIGEGEQVEAFGWLYRLRPPQNPGSYDWAEHYRRQGVEAGLSCGHRECVRPIGTEFAGSRGPITWLQRRARGLLTDDIAAGASEEAGLLEAMVLGHRSQLDRRLNDVFINAGCAHFLAVSGTHVVVLMSFVWAAARMAGVSRRQSAWLMLGAVVLYAAVAEPRPSILRAAIMAGLFCASLTLRRSRARLNWLSAAVIALIGLNPEAILDVGFQLSFAAVLGVSYLTPALIELAKATGTVLRRAAGRPSPADLGIEPFPTTANEGVSLVRMAARQTGRRVMRAALVLLIVSVSAWLAGAPVIASHFHRVQPWGPLSSVIVFPLMSVVMLLGFGKIIIGAVSPTAGCAIGVIVTFADALLISVVEQLAALPAASLTVPTPPWWWMIVFYLLLAAVVWRFRPSRTADSLKPPSTTPPGSHLWQTRSCIAALALVVVASLAWARPNPVPGHLRATFLAVGAGLATVIELPDGQTMLYDCGTMSPYDIGRSAVVPFLQHCGIPRVDRVHLSHPNLDHFSGLPAVLEAFDVGPILVNEHFSSRSPPRSPARHLLDVVLPALGRAVTVEDASASSWTIGGVTFERLWPPQTVDDRLSANDVSTVLRLSYKGQSILMTGDIEEQAQQELLEHGRLSADVLVLPHHGSVVPTTAKFIAAVGAEAVVQSSNRWSADNLGGVQELIGAVPTYNTCDMGAIEVTLEAGNVRVRAVED